jgi:hypothetical protein
MNHLLAPQLLPLARAVRIRHQGPIHSYLMHRGGASNAIAFMKKQLYLPDILLPAIG